MNKATRLTPNTPPSIEALRAEHETLDTRLQQLDRLRSLSPEERYEQLVIKKRKLAIKDRIAQLT